MTHATADSDEQYARPRKAGERVRLAVFDFDGTCIDGNSPVLLVKHLAKRRMLRPTVLLKILTWAFAYKFHLPQNETWVRELVFSAFEGKPASEVDAFLGDFYDQTIDPLFRPDAEASLIAHEEAGDCVLLVSATFEPIIRRAMQRRPIARQISTPMCVDENGRYLAKVDGIPTEGAEKLRAIERYADAEFGEGNWTIGFAYADHYSDSPVLEAAQVAYAVTPGPTLERKAKERGWQILQW